MILEKGIIRLLLIKEIILTYLHYICKYHLIHQICLRTVLNKPPIPQRKEIVASQKDMSLPHPKLNNLCEIAEGMDSIEQERYYSRLNHANKKQNAIFDSFMKNYYIPQRQVEEQRRRIDEINDNVFKYQSRQWEEKNIQSKVLNKMNYRKQLKEQIKEKHYQKVLQRSINDELRREIELKNRFLEDQERFIKQNKDENQKLYYECLKNQEKCRNMAPLSRSRNLYSSINYKFK